MKKGLIIFVLFFFSIVYMASANEDVMFKMASETNAHVEIPSQNNYNVKVTYSSIFGAKKTGQVRSCGANNEYLLFKASSVTNAHIGDSRSPYNVNVCYAGLRCSFIKNSNSNACPGQSKPIVRATSTSNAHVGLVNKAPKSAYPYLVCCSASGGAPGGIRAAWTDKNGREIRKSRLGTEVFLNLLNAGGDLPYRILDKNDAVSVSGRENKNPWKVPWKPDLKTKGIKKGEEAFFNFIVTYNNKDYKTEKPLTVSFCGDKVIDPDYGETCDTGGVKTKKPRKEYGKSIKWCDADTCKEEIISGGVCGDNVIQNPPEECDNGKDNGNISKKIRDTNNGWIYCSVDCKEVNYNPSNDLKWRDLSRKEISSAKPGNKVLLTYSNYKRSSGKFRIVNDKGNTLTDIQGVVDNSELSAIFKIPLGLDLKTFSKLQFFEVQEPKKKSNVLTVSKRGGSGGDGIKIYISGVTCGEIISKGATKKISADFSSPNEIIKDAYIKVHGNIIARFSNSPSKKLTVDYKFNTVGTNKIEAYAKTESGEEKQVTYNVVVKDSSTTGKYAAACIRSPKSLSFIKPAGEYVLFDASNSKAYDINRGTASPIPIRNLMFSWKFSDGMTHSGKGNKEISYKFKKAFASRLGNNYAELTVSA